MTSESESGEDFTEDKEESLLRNFEEESQLIIRNLLPKKSFQNYENVYIEFKNWLEKNKTNQISEDVMLVYFDELSHRYKPSTLWAKWSMLKTTLDLRDSIKMENFTRLKSFVKQYGRGYKPKKSLVFTLSNINKFIEEADDAIYLAMKVICIFGICGAMRCDEMTKLTQHDVQMTEVDFQLIVSIRDSKTNYPRTFLIGEPWYGKVIQYIGLRPSDLETNRFFLSYHNNKCHRQVIGKNKISETPKNIALYLNLNEAEKFTGHAFRRSAATLLSNSGASLVDVKSLGGWQSDKVAQGYIENSVFNKVRNFNGIINSKNDQSNRSIPLVSTENDYPSTSAGKNSDQNISGKENLISNARQASLGRNIQSCNSSAKKRKLEVSESTSSNIVENNLEEEISHFPGITFQNCPINTFNIYFHNVPKEN